MKKFIFIVIVVLYLIFSFSPVFAENKINNNTESLSLISSVPQNNAINVDSFSEISVRFNQNVVNTDVKDINSKAVTLWANGKEVSARNVLSDDLLNPEDSGTIKIQPTTPLKPGTHYTIKVDTTLNSIAGEHLQTPIQIQFSTLSEHHSVPATIITIVVLLILMIIMTSIVIHQILKH
ncbi:MAG: Ig-like domain-containing protein [Eubacterium sp.]